MEEVGSVDVDDPVMDVLAKMQTCPAVRALVLDDGRLEGIVSPIDVRRVLERTAPRHDGGR